MMAGASPTQSGHDVTETNTFNDSNVIDDSQLEMKQDHVDKTPSTVDDKFNLGDSSPAKDTSTNEISRSEGETTALTTNKEVVISTPSETSSEEDSSSGEDSDGDNTGENGNAGGLSQYERLRLERIERNKARLAKLGFSEEPKLKKKTPPPKVRRAVVEDAPRRFNPGRSAKVQFYEIMNENARNDESSRRDKRDEEKNVDLCFKCQRDEGDVICCELCNKVYHADCHMPPVTSIDETGFRCIDCVGRKRRIACGLCDACTRTYDCGTCVICVNKLKLGSKSRSKCIFRRCQGNSKRRHAQNKVRNNDKERVGDAHSDECYTCGDGGDLICCDRCDKSFHAVCHKPKIHSLPEGEWLCMHCRKPPSREKKPLYSGTLVADLGYAMIRCTVRFPKIQCVVCDGEEVTGVHKPPDWTTCRTCGDSFHLKCLTPPMENRPTDFKCSICKERPGAGSWANRESKPLYDGENSEWCFVCDDGGDLLCCDYCEKSFHLHCHIPELFEIPTGRWKCCECAATEYKRKMKCGECPECRREDCGVCLYCLDKPKFGGPGKMKQTCMKKMCRYKRFAPPATVAPENANKRKRKELSQQFKAASSPANKRKRCSSGETPRPEGSKNTEQDSETASSSIGHELTRGAVMETPPRTPLKSPRPNENTIDSINAECGVPDLTTEGLSLQPDVQSSVKIDDIPDQKKGNGALSVTHVHAADEVSVLTIETKDKPQLESADKRKKGRPKSSRTPKQDERRLKSDPLCKKVRGIINEALKKSNDSEIVDKSCKRLRGLITSFENADKIMHFGGIKLMSKAIKEHSENILLLEEVCGTLAELIWMKSSCISLLVEECCLPSVIEAMKRHRTHTRVQLMACGVFRALSYDFANHETITDVNGVEEVVESMKRNSLKYEILNEGCFFIQNIACNPDISSKVIDSIISNGLIDLVMDSSKAKPENVDFLRAVFGVLTNLALNEDAKTAIGNHERTIPLVLEILKIDHNMHLSKSALSTLKLLAMGNVKNKSKIVLGGGINTIIKFLTFQVENVLLLATGLGLLRELVSESVKNSDTMMEANGLEFVTSTMGQYRDLTFIQAGACGILRYLVLRNTEQAESAIGLILTAMAFHKEDSVVQFEGCQALLHCCVLFPTLASSLRTDGTSQVLSQSQLSLSAND